MTGGALNLSLLSRGVGEVQKNGHEKVEVFLEPEDYHNFSKNTEKFYLPPIHSSYPTFIDGSPNLTTRSSREAMEFRVPKTFTTRKGALLLFSEDLAQRNMERAAAAAAAAKRQNTHHSFDNALTPAHSFDAQLNLKTVEDLANSILKYGSHNRVEDKMFLKFIHARQENFDRQIRPGYSAKRYLSTWTRTWDDRVFDNVIKHGYINERSLYQYNLLAPHLRRRLFTEDLSHMPQPYRLMRNMLMTPGSLSGYTFYRAPTQHALDEEDQTDYETFTLKKRPTDRLKHIRVIKTQGGIQEEVAYSDLDRESQKEVITDLLVKSAVHYALKKQEEMYEESIIMAVKSEQTAGQTGGLVERKTVEFDMNEAVDSLLDTPHGGFAITADLPDADRKSQGSDLTGSFKGAPVPPHAVRQHQSTHRALPALEHTDKEYFGGVPVVAVRDGSTASDSSSVRSHPSNVPQLPPIRHTLSPIRDVSRETTQQNLSLPPIAKAVQTVATLSEYSEETDSMSSEPPTVNIQPATPQHSNYTGTSGIGASDANATRGLVSRDDADALLEEEEFDTDTEGDRKSRKKTDMSVTSLQSTVKTKGQSSEGPAVHSSHDSIQAPASGISGTSKTRPNWRSRKGSSPDEQETGILFRPEEDSPSLSLTSGLHGHTPIRASPFGYVPINITPLGPAPTDYLPKGPASVGHAPVDPLSTGLKSLGQAAPVSNSLPDLSPASIDHAPRTFQAWDRKRNPMRRHRGSKSNSGVDSIKGSMVLAPDGEIISVGGSVVRGGAGHDVGNINDLMIGRHEGAVTDESGVSDEEPDEWRGGTQKKHSIFSHKSEGSKRPQKRGSATTTASSVSKEDIEKLSTTGKQILLDQASRVSEIDYTSGDIDATISIHSWSYSARDPEGEFGTLAHASSVRSMPADGGSVSQRSSVTEKDIMDTLTDHAQRIAESVLSQPDAGRDLERDVKDAIAEIMKNRRASSAAPTAAEYRDLIKKSLAVAAAKAAGIDPDSISEDAEISPQLLEALASQKLTPEQIEIVSDGEGRTVIQSRVDLAESMGGVEEGHLYIAPGKKGEDSTLSKRQVSIPADRASVVDDMEFDRISYQGTDVMSEKGEKGKGPKSKTGSIAGGTMADLTEVEGVMAQIENKVEDSPDQDDEFVKAVEEAQGVTGAETVKTSPPSTVKAPTSGITTPSGEDRSVPPASAGEATLPERSEVAELPDQGFVAEKKPEDAQSVKSGKTGVSQKSEASKDSKARSKKSKSPEEKEEPFVVGKVNNKGELEKLYGPVDLPPPKVEEKAKPTAPVKEDTPPPLPEPGPESAPTTDVKKTESAPSAEPDQSTEPAPAGEATAEEGAVDHVAELQKLYGGKPPIPGPPPSKGKPKDKKPKKEPKVPKKEEEKKPKKGKKGKKGKKKEEEPEPAPAEEPTVEAEEPAPQPPALESVIEPTPRKSPTPSEPKPSSPEYKTEEESDTEFNFVREASSPELDPIPQTRLQLPSPPLDDEEDENDDQEDNMSPDEGEESNLKSISNREARAAKRAAAAAKRREEVEKRRREKEEQAKREKEEVERQVALQREMEEERRRREEERRMRKEQQKLAEEKELQEQEEQARRRKLDAERERKAKEEYQRKLEEMKRKQHEEEMRRHELMLQKQKEEEERRLEEEAMLSQMAEQERIEYERKKREEEEERKRKAEEERLKREEEARKAMEEARRLAEEMARKQAELEARLKFNKDLQVESVNLTHAHEINRAFVFSYYELLQWLGLDIPEFELAKLADY